MGWRRERDRRLVGAAMVVVLSAVGVAACGSGPEAVAHEDGGAVASVAPGGATPSTDVGTTRARPPTSLPQAPPRAIPTPIDGDTELFDRVRAARGNWTTVSGSAGPPGGERGRFDVRGHDGFTTTTPNGMFEGQIDDVMVTITPGRKTAGVVQTPKGPSPGAAPAGPERLPEEAPTNTDTLNLMLAPSFWLRATVEPNATKVTFLGEEDVGGRAARRYQILFGGPTGEKWGDGGWEWWVDEATGIILRSSLTFADGQPTQVVELRDLVFDHVTGPLEVPDIPAGYQVNVVAVGPGGAVKQKTETLATAEAPASLLQAVSR